MAELLASSNQGCILTAAIRGLQIFFAAELNPLLDQWKHFDMTCNNQTTTQDLLSFPQFLFGWGWVVAPVKCITSTIPPSSTFYSTSDTQSPVAGDQMVSLRFFRSKYTFLPILTVQ